MVRRPSRPPGNLGANASILMGRLSLRLRGQHYKVEMRGAQPRMATSLGPLQHLARNKLPGHAMLTGELLRIVAIAARHHHRVFDRRLIPFP